MNRLRRELYGLLARTDCRRPPALRRSPREDALYATDLPQAADEDAVREFTGRAERAGWRTETGEGWIRLDYTGEIRAAEAFPGETGPEGHCCAELLRRHPAGRRNGDRERRMLVKAGEEGAAAYEKTCAALHREWAAALRRGEPLPDLTEEWFREEGKT